MCSACKNVDLNKLGALLSGKRKSNVLITYILIWTGNVGSSAMKMLQTCVPKITIRRSNVPLGIYHLGLTLK